MLETLDHTIRIGSTPTFLYFDLYLHSAYPAHYVYFIVIIIGLGSRNLVVSQRLFPAVIFRCCYVDILPRNVVLYKIVLYFNKSFSTLALSPHVLCVVPRHVTLLLIINNE